MWLSFGNDGGVRAAAGADPDVDCGTSDQRRFQLVDLAAAGHHLFALHDHHVRPGLESGDRCGRLGLDLDPAGCGTGHHEVGADRQQSPADSGIRAELSLVCRNTCQAGADMPGGDSSLRSE